jgi:glycosyltransferase involved in cell wall biosynthesis
MMKTSSEHNPDTKVCVIIPTYNRCAWIKHAIDSVLQQTYQNFELLIVDDGSTDITKGILSEYGNKIKYFYQSNKGPAAARNIGIKQSKGTYICFLDSDDRWVKSKLETQVNLVTEHPEIKICYTDETWIRKGIRVNQKRIHQKYSGWIYQRCLPLCIISPSSVMIHREVFDKVGYFDEDMTVCEDYDLWLRISHLYPICFINEKKIVKYGGHEDQLSSKYWGVDQFRVKALEKMLQKKSLSSEDRTATIKMLHRKCDILANGFLKREKNEQAEYFDSLKNNYSIK